MEATNEVPVSTTGVEQAPVVEVKQNLFQRVGSFKKETPVESESQTPNQASEGDKFDFKEYQATLASIKDPSVKMQLEKAYKSFESGYNKKFQSLAEERKSYETKQKEFELKLQQAQQPQQRQWTPEEVRKLVNDPTFVQAAQVIAQEQAPAESGMTDQEWSSLSDTERQQFSMLQRKVAELENKTFQETIQRKNAELDSQLKTKYPNYQPEAIDTLTADLIAGKVQATREHLYKVQYHDENVNNAYELGRQDALRELKDKSNSSSFTGGRVNANVGEKPETGESSKNFFMRIAQRNLEASNGQNIRK